MERWQNLMVRQKAMEARTRSAADCSITATLSVVPDPLESLWSRTGGDVTYSLRHIHSGLTLLNPLADKNRQTALRLADWSVRMNGVKDALNANRAY